MADQETTPLRGLTVGQPGVYLLLDDVVASLRYLAEYEEHELGRQALQEAAGWFGGVIVPDEPGSASERPEEARARPYGGEDALPELGIETEEGPISLGDFIQRGAHVAGDGSVHAGPRVARVEVFPNEDASYWYARAVDHAGVILAQPNHTSGIRREDVIAAAEREWPGAPIYEVPDALTDSIWNEQNPSATWNGRQRPSDRRLFQR